MVNEIRIYFEGHKSLREGFSHFFSEIREKGWRAKFIAGRGGDQAIEDFKDSLRTHREAWNILLKDSEGPDDGNLLRQLQDKHGLNTNLKDSVFWMVQLMEAWFLADVNALAEYYGQGFNAKALRANPDVERVPKNDVMKKLAEATKSTKKGKYDETTKTTHAPDLLAKISPTRVKKASENCHRMFKTILSRAI